MKQLKKAEKEIEKFFKELIKKYPLLDSLGCDIKGIEGKEFIYKYRGGS